MLIITVIYALITILGIGSALNPILDKCGVLAKDKQDAVKELEETGEVQEGEQRKKCCMGVKNTMFKWDQRYFKPTFTI